MDCIRLVQGEDKLRALVNMTIKSAVRNIVMETRGGGLEKGRFVG